MYEIVFNKKMEDQVDNWFLHYGNSESLYCLQL